MKATQYGKYLTTVPVLVWWLAEKIEETKNKKCGRNKVNTTKRGLNKHGMERNKNCI